MKTGTRVLASPSRIEMKLIVPVLVFGMLGALWLTRSSAAKERAVPRNDAALVAELRSEIEQLKREQRAMGARIATAAAAPAGPSADTPAAQERAEAEPVERPPAPSAKELYAGLERDFAAEPVDRGWASATEDSLGAVVRKVDQVDLVSSSCRTRMCRLEVRVPNHDVQETFEQDFSVSPPVLGKNVWTQRFPAEDGSSRLVVIVSRGALLPIPGMVSDGDSE